MSILIGPKIPVFSGASVDDFYLADGNKMLRMLQALVQPNVIALQNDPPVGPADGDTYIVLVGTGAWAGHNNAIAYYTTQNLSTPGWEFWAPLAGWLAFNGTDGLTYRFNGTSWAVFGQSVIELPDTFRYLYSAVLMGGASASASIATPVGDAWNSSTIASGNFTGPFVPNANSVSPFIKLTVGTTSSDLVVIGTSSIASRTDGAWWTGKKITWTATLRFEATPLNLRAWVGLFGATDGVTVAGSDTPAANILGFRLSPAGSGANWFGISGISSPAARTAVDTGVAGNTTAITLKLVWTPGTGVDFYVNGTKVGSSTTNLPPSNVTLYPAIAMNAKGGIAGAILLDYMSMYIQQATN